MTLPKRARSGGPKTAAGRAAGSNNALKHGLTAAGAVTVGEADRANSLRSALLAQYTPQTPLEKLQIERIARTAAKLQRLHEIEEAAFRLAQEDALPSMAEIVANMGPTDPEVQEEAVRVLLSQGRMVRLDPTDKVLAQMCDEIRANGARVATYDDVCQRLPATYAFVEASCAQTGTTDPGLQLQALAAMRRPVVAAPEEEDGEVSMSTLIQLNDTELMTITNSKSRRQARAVGTVLVHVRLPGSPSVSGLQEDLNAFLALQRHRQAVDDLLHRYPARRATLQQAALPPAEQADRLMRYQVSLDRQLSKCMGELLQMIAMRQPAVQQ